MAAAPGGIPQLSREDAKAAVTEAAARLDEPSNQAALKQAIDAAAGDMAKVMSTVPMVALGMIKDVVEKYGFQASVPGVMQFVMAINMHRMDPEIAERVAHLQSKFMPTFAMPPAPVPQQ